MNADRGRPSDAAKRPLSERLLPGVQFLLTMCIGHGVERQEEAVVQLRRLYHGFIERNVTVNSGHVGAGRGLLQAAFRHWTCITRYLAAL